VAAEACYAVAARALHDDLRAHPLRWPEASFEHVRLGAGARGCALQYTPVQAALVADGGPHFGDGRIAYVDADGGVAVSGAW